MIVFNYNMHSRVECLRGMRKSHMHWLIEDDRKDVIKCKIYICFVFLRMKQVLKTVVDLLICCYANRKILNGFKKWDNFQEYKHNQFQISKIVFILSPQGDRVLRELV